MNQKKKKKNELFTRDIKLRKLKSYLYLFLLTLTLTFPFISLSLFFLFVNDNKCSFLSYRQEYPKGGRCHRTPVKCSFPSSAVLFFPSALDCLQISIKKKNKEQPVRHQSLENGDNPCLFPECCLYTTPFISLFIYDIPPPHPMRCAAMPYTEIRKS